MHSRGKVAGRCARQPGGRHLSVLLLRSNSGSRASSAAEAWPRWNCRQEYWRTSEGRLQYATRPLWRYTPSKGSRRLGQ